MATDEARLIKNQKMITENTFYGDNGMKMPLIPQIKTTLEQVNKILPLQIEFRKDQQRIADSYTPKLEKLLK